MHHSTALHAQFYRLPRYMPMYDQLCTVLYLAVQGALFTRYFVRSSFINVFKKPLTLELESANIVPAYITFLSPCLPPLFSYRTSSFHYSPPHLFPGLCSRVHPAAPAPTATCPACRGSSRRGGRRRGRRRGRRGSGRGRRSGNVPPAHPLPSSPTSQLSALTLSCPIRRSVLCACTVYMYVCMYMLPCTCTLYV